MNSKPKVLIVDDSLTVRMDLKEAFEGANFEVILCESVDEARKALGKTTIHLVILDVHLPDGSGIDLLKEIRASSKISAYPVMFLSSEAEVRDRNTGLTVGADEYIGKPYDISYVIARARQLVHKAFPPESSRDKQTILIIDDSLTYREELKKILEEAGYGILSAETGEDGLRLAISSQPDAIIIDGNLPGIDGTTTVTRMKSDIVLRNTPCLVLTASQDRSAEFAALEAGADIYVRKDEDTTVLLARLGAILKSTPSQVRRTAGDKSLLSPKRILAVDDSLTYVHSLADLLREDGYDVITAQSGEEALELLKIQAVDCILLDRLMPGLSGQETCRRIKSTATWRDIPLIMLTAQEGREAMLDGFNAGADDYISKSNESEVLKVRLRAQLRRKQFEDDNRRINNELLRKEAEAVESRVQKELAETRGRLLRELEVANRELEAFSSSVSHDLRAPLRSMAGFTQILLEEYGDKLDEKGRDYLNRVINSSQRMGELIDGLLDLSKFARAEKLNEVVDLTAIVRALITELQNSDPHRKVTFQVIEGAKCFGDHRLLRAALQNLLGNAWKFTSKCKAAKIEFGQSSKDGEKFYFIKDNGDGFDMAYASKLFVAFQRLHSDKEFPGTGIGLATVQKIVLRHGGRIWAESSVKQGASFYFTLPEK